MKITSHSKRSTLKKKAISDFADHVSSGKAAFFQKYGMDFVMGPRKGPYMRDIDGAKRLFNLHCNGGVFNLGHRNIELIELLKAGLDDYDIGNHHFMSKARADLARKLAELMPGDLGYVVFGVGGGEAVDLAFKVARAFHLVMPRLSRMPLIRTRPPLFLRLSRPRWGLLSRPRIICNRFA